MTTYTTVSDVEIISAGMNWRGGAKYFITAEHLKDMVAAQADPLIRSPRVKLGHFDAIFGALAGMHDPGLNATDGEPGFGTVCNLRLVEGGAKIIGDLTEVPAWLADAMPSAYPTRSAEWVWDYETQGGHCYTAVLTDLALGGVWEPAVEDLADITREQATAALQALLAEGPEAAVAALQAEEAPMATRTATASVSVDRIVGQFEDWAWGMDEPHDGFNTYWWFARDVRVDPDEVIAADGEGGTYRVPFTTDGEHQVTFGVPVEVRETYVDLSAAGAAASAAQARHTQQVLAHDLPTPDRITNHKARATAEPEPKEPRMDTSVRTFLEGQGLDPETASEDQINAASVFAAASALPDPEGGPKPDPPEDPPKPEDGTDPPEEDLPPAAASTAIDDERDRKLEEVTQEVASMKQKETTDRRDGLATAWVQDGRIAPAEHDHYRGLLDIDETKTVALASKLSPGRVPVDGSRGIAALSEITSTGWFPSLISKEA